MENGRLVRLFTVLFCGLASYARAADDLLLADFEGKDYGAWKTTGDAFGPGPAQGALTGQMSVAGFIGHGLVNTFFKGDDTTGTLTSPPFKVDHKYISFLIGGGGYADKTCVNLVIDGKTVRTATGPNTQPGGTENLASAAWDVAEFAGKEAHVEIIDAATGGWGHINVDQIVLTDRKPPMIVKDAKREVALSKRFLNFPVKTGATMRRLSVRVDDKVVRDLDIELADGKPDFWAFLDVSAWAGKPAVIRVDKLSEDSAALSSIEQTDEPKPNGELYQEPLRPQFHFSPRLGWTNDPNGLVFYKGEYHLFFQHNPYGWAWGNMHWGHAVSPDLVHWKQLPIAIYPKEHGDWVFSGSALVDTDNTSGFKKGGEDVLVAAFTSTGRGECIVYSNDRGRTWSEYEGNPVVKHNGRDPRLFWYAPGKHWVMAVYDESGQQGIAFYTSPDLKKWDLASKTNGFFECPDIFELPLDGDATKSKWILTAASSEYMIGTFDGKTFTPETKKLPGHQGNSFYAAQTFSNEPNERRVQIGWGQVATPGMPFNQMMFFPAELTLKTTADGPRVCWQPVKEIEKLWATSKSLKGVTLKQGENPLAEMKGELVDLNAEFEVKPESEFGIRIHGADIHYDAKTNTLSSPGRTLKVNPIDGRIKLRVLADRTSLELYVNDGSVYIPTAFIMNGEAKPPEVYCDTTIKNLEARELRSAWR